MQSINEVIRELREDHNLKQSEVANYLGITQQTYSNYETGDSEFPTRHLTKLADLYHVSVDYILGRVSYPSCPPGLDQPLVDGKSAGEFLSQLQNLDAGSLRFLSYFIEFLLSRKNP